MSTRFRLAALVYMMTNAVIFGAGLVTILTVPSLADAAFDYIPMIVAASFILAAPIAWMIAPRLRSHYHREGDLISGPTTVRN